MSQSQKNSFNKRSNIGGIFLQYLISHLPVFTEEGTSPLPIKPVALKTPSSFSPSPTFTSPWRRKGSSQEKVALLRMTAPTQASCPLGPSGEQWALRLPSSLLLYEKYTMGDTSPLTRPLYSLVSHQQGWWSLWPVRKGGWWVYAEAMFPPPSPQPSPGCSGSAVSSGWGWDETCWLWIQIASSNPTFTNICRVSWALAQFVNTSDSWINPQVIIS